MATIKNILDAASKEAKKDQIVKVWAKLNDLFVEIGSELDDAEVAYVKDMMQQRENFMLKHAGYRKAYNQLSGKEELIK